MAADAVARLTAELESVTAERDAALLEQAHLQQRLDDATASTCTLANSSQQRINELTAAVSFGHAFPLPMTAMFEYDGVAYIFWQW
jgi:hypothetical protein